MQGRFSVIVRDLKLGAKLTELFIVRNVCSGAWAFENAHKQNSVLHLGLASITSTQSHLAGCSAPEVVQNWVVVLNLLVRNSPGAAQTLVLGVLKVLTIKTRCSSP